MKLKSATKHRRFKNRLLISMLTMALRFSYSLISKDSVFGAEGSGTYNIRAVDTYYYGVLTYNLENTPANYIKLGTGTTPIASPTTPNYYYHYKFAFNNYGCYNGRLKLTFARGSVGVVDSIIVEGAVLYSSTNDTSGFYITIEFNGDKYATMDIYIRTATNSLSYTECTALDTWTEHGNSVAENVENAYNRLVDINNAISTINTYANQINDKLALSNNHLFDIVSNTTTLVTNTNNIKTNTDTIKSNTSTISSRIGTTNTKLTGISTRLDQVKSNTDTIIDKMSSNTTDVQLINDIDSNMNIINNIEAGFLNDLDIEIISGKNGYEYIRDVLVDKQIHTSAKNTLSVYQNEMIGPFGVGQHIFSYLHQYLTLIIAFILIGVIIG